MFEKITSFVPKALEDALKLEQGYTEQKQQCRSCSHFEFVINMNGRNEVGCSLHTGSLGKLVRVSEGGYCNRFMPKNRDMPHDWSTPGVA